jgi:UDP-N-acetylmuramyl pentapeptide synthase
VTFGEDNADVTLVDYAPTDDGGHLTLDIFGATHQLVLGLVGKHAAIDACAAIAAAHAAGASIAQALAGIARARPPSMRGEIVDVHGRKVIVDCYNANPASMAAAMRALAERAHGVTALAVVGDMLELGEHSTPEHQKAGALAKQLDIRVIALGAQAQIVASASGGVVSPDPVTAARTALDRTKAGDWILLKASRGMRLERVLEAMKEAKA